MKAGISVSLNIELITTIDKLKGKKTRSEYIAELLSRCIENEAKSPEKGR